LKLESEKDDIEENENIPRNLVGLESFLPDVQVFDGALEILNIEGEKRGISLKRDNIHYCEIKAIRDKRILCAHKDQKKTENSLRNAKEIKKVLRKSMMLDHHWKKTLALFPLNLFLIKKQ